jgi:hypothetical protein
VTWDINIVAFFFVAFFIVAFFASQGDAAARERIVVSPWTIARQALARRVAQGYRPGPGAPRVERVLYREITAGPRQVGKFQGRAFRPGDQVKVDRGPFVHFGTVTGVDAHGEPLVVHPIKGRGGARWRETGIREFAAGREVRGAGTPRDPEQAVRAARARIGQGGYNLLTRNCETTTTGRNGQLHNIAKGAAAGAVLGPVGAIGGGFLGWLKNKL